MILLVWVLNENVLDKVETKMRNNNLTLMIQSDVK